VRTARGPDYCTPALESVRMMIDIGSVESVDALCDVFDWNAASIWLIAWLAPLDVPLDALLLELLLELLDEDSW
jgi:hypothetical protein